jgi:hypothetical protein
MKTEDANPGATDLLSAPITENSNSPGPVPAPAPRERGAFPTRPSSTAAGREEPDGPGANTARYAICVSESNGG